MLFIPYRAKSSPERFPYVTLGLIVINILIYFATANLTNGGDPDNGFLEIKKHILEGYAVSWITMLHAPWRLLTSIFLHQNLEHVLGNMLFLWAFGPIVEGRLGYARYLGLYLLTGIASGFFQTMVVTVINPDVLSLGASGAIMGIAGACLWLFPFASICQFYIGVPAFLLTLLRPDRNDPRFGLGIFSIGLTEWAARWFVLYYFSLDLLNGFFAGNDGVGHFAHMSGFLSGLGLAALSKARRDGKRVSTAQDMRTSGVILEALSVEQLAKLIRVHPDDANLIVAYGAKVTSFEQPNWEVLLIDALRRFGPVLSEKGDPAKIIAAAIVVSPEKGKLPIAPLLRTGTRLEKLGKGEDLRLAAQLYKMLFKQEKTGPEAETVLMRYAQVTERMVNERIADNPNEAIVLYQTLIRRFPQSAHIIAAHTALERLGAPALAFSSGSSAAAIRPTAPRSSDDLRPLR